MTSAEEHNQSTFDVGAPTAAEMAAAEAELQAMGSVQPLPATTIDRLLREPFAGAVVTPPRAPIARMVAMAAMLLLAISGIAWAGMRVVWPVQKNPETRLPLTDAIALVTEPGRNDNARRSAIVVMLDHASHGADAIATATKDSEAKVAAKAESVRQSLLARLQQIEASPPIPRVVDALGLAQKILDRSLDTAARIQALDDVDQLITACLHAMNSARYDTSDVDRFRAASRQTLREALSR